MNSVLVVTLALSLLIPSTAFAQYVGNVGSGGEYTLEEALEIQRRRIALAEANPAPGSQTLPTDKATLDVKLTYGAIEPNNPTKINIDFINPQTQKVQEHVDYTISITKEDESIFGPIPLTHTSIGTVKIPVEFNLGVGVYAIDIEVEGILFQPIPTEIVSFNVIVNENPPEPRIPQWVKNIFLWFGQDQISEDEIINAIEYLINEGTIKVGNSPLTPEFTPQLQTIVSVETDASSYENGDIIVLSGKINGYDSTNVHLLSYTITSPENNITNIGQISLKSDGTFSDMMIAGGPLWKLTGDYTIKITYGPTYDTVKINYLGGVVHSPTPEPEPSSESTISVQTDDKNYDEGDTIVISGLVTTVVGETPVTLQLFTEGNLVDIAQITVAQDGTYSHTVIAEGPLWNKAGEYLVRVLYGEGNIAESEFSYTPKSEIVETTTIFEVDAGGHGTFDVEYTIKGGTVKDMIVDADIFALRIQIDSTDEGKIDLDLPREFIGAEKQDGKDDTFIILIDGIEVPYQESVVHSDSRVITINFEEGDSDIRILGTYIA